MPLYEDHYLLGNEDWYEFFSTRISKAFLWNQANVRYVQKTL